MKTAPCAYCTMPIIHENARGKKPKYCSVKCKNRDYFEIHRERLLKLRAIYAKERKEKLLAAPITVQVKHAERLKKYNSDYYQKHKDSRKKHMNKYYLLNREEIIKKMREKREQKKQV